MYSVEPIGVIESPYKEKFAVPRQPSLVPSATSRIKLLGKANCLESIRGIEQFDHIWLLFMFDQNLAAGWKPTVRPPRLGGNERIGVFASRSTFRPNGIGMSAVQLRGVSQSGDQVYLDLGGIDLVDETPIVDIKPYIPYTDSIKGANGGYAESPPETLGINFSSSCREVLNNHPNRTQVYKVICEVLAQDPRPAYKKGKADDKIYSVKLFDLDVRFKANDSFITVVEVVTA